MKLKLKEVIDLNFELNGISVGGKVISNGLLQQKASMKVKLYIQRLNKIVADELKTFNETNKELFEKYAVEVKKDKKDKKDKKEGAEPEKEIPEDKREEYKKEYDDLLNAEKEIDVVNLWSNDLTIDNLATIETDEVYPVFFKLIDAK